MCSVWKTASLNFSQKISHEYLKLEGDRQREEKKWVASLPRFDGNIFTMENDVKIK